ncbi:unnamed protein product [Arctogadus glacialis]
MWAISELGRPSGPVMIAQVIGGRRSVPPSTVEVCLPLRWSCRSQGLQLPDPVLGPRSSQEVLGRSAPPCTRAFILLADLKPAVGLCRSTTFIQAETENNTNRVL